jgi:hypothetical protein
MSAPCQDGLTQASYDCLIEKWNVRADIRVEEFMY